MSLDAIEAKLESIDGHLTSMDGHLTALTSSDVIAMVDIISLLFVFPAFLTGWAGMNLDYIPFLKGRRRYRLVSGLSLLWILSVMIYLLNRRGGISAFRTGYHLGRHPIATVVLSVGVVLTCVWTVTGFSRHPASARRRYGAQ